MKKKKKSTVSRHYKRRTCHHGNSNRSLGIHFARKKNLIGIAFRDTIVNTKNHT